MKLDLMSMLRDVAVDPQADPNHVYLTVHAGGIPVTLPVQVGHGLPQTITDVIAAAGPSIQSGHFTAQSLGIGLLTAYLQHQAMAQAPAAATRAVPVPQVLPVAMPTPAAAPVVSAPAQAAGYVQDSGGFDGPSR